jgi:hypothetical protein
MIDGILPHGRGLSPRVSASIRSAALTSEGSTPTRMPGRGDAKPEHPHVLCMRLGVGDFRRAIAVADQGDTLCAEFVHQIYPGAYV